MLKWTFIFNFDSQKETVYAWSKIWLILVLMGGINDFLIEECRRQINRSIYIIFIQYFRIYIICSLYIELHLIATDIFTNDMIAVIIYPSLLIVAFSEFSNQILDILIPLNYSRPRKLIFKVEYFVDEQKYFYPIAMHTITFAIFGSTVLFATETLAMAIMQHICGLCKIIRWAELMHDAQLSANI